MQITISSPDQSELNTNAERKLAAARSIIIDSPDMYEISASELTAIKKRAKELEEQRTSIVKPLNEAVKNINAMFKTPLEFLSEAESVIKKAMLGYDQEQEKKRRAEQAALEAKAAEERRKQNELAAQVRAKAEAEAEANRKAADEARQAGDSAKAAQLEVRADAVVEKAEYKAANASLEAEMTIATVTQIQPTSVKGISTKTLWKAEITNKMELIKFVAENPQYINLLDGNTSAINSLAKSLKGAMQVSGIRVYEEKILASRAA